MYKKNSKSSAKKFLVLIFSVLLLTGMLLPASCSSNDGKQQGTVSKLPDASKTQNALPDDFSFSITWNCYGDSTYDSSSGKLVKQKSATKPSEFTATLTLTDEQKLNVYKLLTQDIDLFSYPAFYDPFYPQESEPVQTIIVSMTANGKTKSVKCIDVALDGANNCSGKKDKDFLKVVESITALLTATEEWKALPEWEHLYA